MLKYNEDRYAQKKLKKNVLSQSKKIENSRIKNGNHENHKTTWKFEELKSTKKFKKY